MAAAPPTFASFAKVAASRVPSAKIPATSGTRFPTSSPAMARARCRSSPREDDTSAACPLHVIAVTPGNAREPGQMGDGIQAHRWKSLCGTARDSQG